MGNPEQYYSMEILKLIWQTIMELIKQAWQLPRSVATAVKRKRQRRGLNDHEAERLDRLRNPSKYRESDLKSAETIKSTIQNDQS